jgi:hypothetical protein
MEQTYGSIYIFLSSGCIVLFVAVSVSEAPISGVHSHGQASDEWHIILSLQATFLQQTQFSHKYFGSVERFYCNQELQCLRLTQHKLRYILIRLYIALMQFSYILKIKFIV